MKNKESMYMIKLNKNSDLASLLKEFPGYKLYVSGIGDFYLHVDTIDNSLILDTLPIHNYYGAMYNEHYINNDEHGERILVSEAILKGYKFKYELIESFNETITGECIVTGHYYSDEMGSDIIIIQDDEKEKIFSCLEPLLSLKKI